MNDQSQEPTTTRVRTALAGLPDLRLGDPEAVLITRLGGLTNLVFRVENASSALCLRLAGAGTEDYIDRVAEAHNAAAAAAAGVGPGVLHADPDTGVMVSEFLHGCQT
ncbi:MAG: hypothetical protein ACC631_08335, partial [Halocynthiibacter sp.]